MPKTKRTLPILGGLLAAILFLSGYGLVQALEDTSPPSVPVNLTADAVSSVQINLDWDTATDNVGVTGYEVFRNDAQVATTTGSFFINTSLTASTTYSYKVRAIDSAGNRSDFSSSLSITTLSTSSDVVSPTAPANLTADVISSSQINLDWDQAADNVGVAGYIVFRNGAQIATTTNTYFHNTGLSAGTAYTYRIKAYDAAGNRSLYSNAVTATTASLTADNQNPSAPKNLEAIVISYSQINLAWDAASDNVGVTGYEVFRNNLKIATTTDTFFNDTGLKAGTTYAYKVRAMDRAGNKSSFSNIVTTATQGTAINDMIKLKAHVVSYQHVNLKWKKSNDDVKVAGYLIYRDGVQVAKVKRNHYNDIGLEPGTEYTYMVKAYDNNGNLSDPSNQITVTTKERKEKYHEDSDDDDYNDDKGRLHKMLNKINKNWKKHLKNKD